MEDLIETILTITDDPRRDYSNDKVVTQKLLEVLTEQLQQHCVSVKRPTLQGIRAVATRYANKNKVDKQLSHYDLRIAFISAVEWYESFMAACASGAVDKNVCDGVNHIPIKSGGYRICKECRLTLDE